MLILAVRCDKKKVARARMSQCFWCLKVGCSSWQQSDCDMNFPWDNYFTLQIQPASAFRELRLAQFKKKKKKKKRIFNVCLCFHPNLALTTAVSCYCRHGPGSIPRLVINNSDRLFFSSCLQLFSVSLIRVRFAGDAACPSSFPKSFFPE